VATATQRQRFSYYAPIIGRVCKEGIERVFKITHRTLTIYRKRALHNEVFPKPHGNRGNAHAKRIDAEAVVDWIHEVAAIEGEVVGVRVRRVEREGGVSRLMARAENYTLLPCSYTWEFLYEQFKTFVQDEFPGEKACSLRSFKRVVHLRFPNLRIRAPRDNVCDICTILRSRMASMLASIVILLFDPHVRLR
jgi:hypothetical protein